MPPPSAAATITGMGLPGSPGARVTHDENTAARSGCAGDAFGRSIEHPHVVVVVPDAEHRRTRKGRELDRHIFGARVTNTAIPPRKTVLAATIARIATAPNR